MLNRQTNPVLNKRNILYAGIHLQAILLLILMLCSCNQDCPLSERVKALPDSLIAKARVDTTKFVLAEYKFEGKIIFDKKKLVKIYPTADGRINKINTYQGKYVQEGDVLAVVHIQQSMLHKNRLFRAQQNFSIAEHNFHAAKALYKNGAQSYKNYKTAEVEYQAAESELKQRQATLHNSCNIIDNKEIITFKSPLNGFIMENLASEGMDLIIRDSQHIFSIINAKDILISAEISGRSTIFLNIGDTVNFESECWPGKTFAAKIIAVNFKVGGTKREIKIKPLKPELLINNSMPNRVTVSFSG